MARVKAKHLHHPTGYFNCLPSLIRTAEAYINDTFNRLVTPQQVQDKIQSIAQTWKTLLYGTGGELSLNKTYLWLLYWLWEGGKACLATKQDCPESMTITIGREISPSKVQHKDPHELVKQLSILTNLAGDFSKELERR
eukprot:15364802-Ditylum_brightwellii.AAC.2